VTKKKIKAEDNVRKEDLKQMLKKQSLKTTFAKWRSYTSEKKSERTCESLAAVLWNRGLASHSLSVLAAYATKRRQKRYLQSKANLARQSCILKGVFSLWRGAVAERKQENNAISGALYVWAISLQWKVLKGWKQYVEERRKKKSNYVWAAEKHRQFLQTESVQILLTASSLIRQLHLSSLQETRSKKDRIEDKIAIKYVEKWKQFVVKNKMVRRENLIKDINQGRTSYKTLEGTNKRKFKRPEETLPDAWNIASKIKPLPTQVQQSDSTDVIHKGFEPNTRPSRKQPRCPEFVRVDSGKTSLNLRLKTSSDKLSDVASKVISNREGSSCNLLTPDDFEMEQKNQGPSEFKHEKRLIIEEVNMLKGQLKKMHERKNMFHQLQSSMDCINSSAIVDESYKNYYKKHKEMLFILKHAVEADKPRIEDMRQKIEYLTQLVMLHC